MAAKTILVVDDEKDIVELVAYNLEQEGFTVLKAHDGEKALELVRHKHPDLLLLDLMLPGINGLDVCRIIRGKLEMAAMKLSSNHAPSMSISAACAPLSRKTRKIQNMF